MTELQRLEADILELQDRLTLRPVLNLACKMGECLIEAKKLLPHGQWLPWLHRVGMRPRTAQVYMQVAKAQEPVHSERLSLDGFLRIIRQARRAARRQTLEESRRAAADADLPLERQYQVVHADCRKYEWPRSIDCIGTDPPWGDLEAYRWLGCFAKEHLKEGGLLLVQGGGLDLPPILDVLGEAGLTYRWMLATVFSGGGTMGAKALPPFISNMRQVLLFTKGEWDRNAFPLMSDVYTTGVEPKKYHPWQQPLQPWVYWLSRLTAPADLVCDPYCGSATVGCAVKINGAGRRYIGTEIDATTVKVARTRLRDQEEHQGVPGAIREGSGGTDDEADLSQRFERR